VSEMEEMRYQFAVLKDGRIDIELQGSKSGVVFRVSIEEATQMMRDLDVAILEAVNTVA